MSDLGQLPELQSISETASQIQRSWLRDGTIAIKVLARPVSIVGCGFALTVIGLAIAVRELTVGINEWDLGAIAILAGIVGYVARLRSLDKINGGNQQ